MSSTVYFIDLRAKHKYNFVAKLKDLAAAVGISGILKERDLVAVKLHFGEMGNTAFIRPVFVKVMVDSIYDIGAVPFLTDTSTLYVGTRCVAPHHLTTAIRNGFAYPVVNAPIIVADGLRGKSETTITIGQKHFKRVFVASEIVQANALVSVAHFKGHELAGFGGTIKNVGMGCASRKGKLAHQLNYGETIGLGSREYWLERI